MKKIKKITRWSKMKDTLSIHFRYCWEYFKDFINELLGIFVMLAVVVAMSPWIIVNEYRYWKRGRK